MSLVLGFNFEEDLTGAIGGSQEQESVTRVLIWTPRSWLHSYLTL